MEANGRTAGEMCPSRVHIVYFLSHSGQTEQPHFFRAHHASRTGVCLRDIKRWLADLLGKDMPDGFAWSYKRFLMSPHLPYRLLSQNKWNAIKITTTLLILLKGNRKYRTGYIWQDLVDDDLLTPISDNKDVILGSAKLSSSFNDSSASPLKKKQSTKEPEEVKEAAESPDLQSSQSSILTDDDDSITVDLQQEKEKTSLDSSFRFGLLSKKEKKMDVERCRRSNCTSPIVLPAATAAASGTFTWPSAGNLQFPKRKSTYSSRPCHVFRNLITCGAVDTKDAVFVVLSRPGSRTESPAAKYGDHRQEAARKSSTRAKIWTDNDERQRDCSTQKPVHAAYKPALRPSCSQCGKAFKPEKMYKHMRSCSGMKSTAMRKNSLRE